MDKIGSWTIVTLVATALGYLMIQGHLLGERITRLEEQTQLICHHASLIKRICCAEQDEAIASMKLACEE